MAKKLRLPRAKSAFGHLPPEIKLDAVLAAMADAVVISDRTGFFLDFNEPFARLNRFQNKSECARALADYRANFEVCRADGVPLPPEEWPILEALRGKTGSDVELKISRKDTQEEWLGLYNYAPIRMNGGVIVGAVLTGRDITDVRQAEQSLRSLSSRLHLALSSAHLGVWEWDIPHNKLSWDDRMYELYGLNRQNFSTTAEAWAQALHPEDRPAAVDLLGAALRGEKSFDTEFRIIEPDGNVRYLKANGLVLVDKDGRPERMFGVNADITEEKVAKNKLQKAYAEVEAKVVERTGQLEAAKIAAENANKAKDLFLATLSHELRSPLSAILSWTQLLERGGLAPEKVAIGIRTIKESVWAQNQLIGDLLDLSRISTGKLAIERQPTDVVEVLKVAVDSIRPNAEQHGLRIKEDLAGLQIYILADPARLKQSFWNILANAVKFTPAGGNISVSVECLEHADRQIVEILIKDTGRGIKAEFLPHLFERFSQADASSVRVHGGMGLGLSLVKSLVELQGGTVSAESPGEGMGATFRLAFPLITTVEHTGSEQAHLGVTRGILASSGLSELKVLLVEDGEKTRIALAQLLAAQGADVRAEASAKEALETFKTFHPDVVVSDIAMPQEDGHSLVRKIRALGKDGGGNVPAIALTAYAEPRDREEAFASGFQEYLNKPVDAAVLASTILKLTGRDGPTTSVKNWH